MSTLTRKPVKVTMLANAEHYNDIGRMMDDLAKLLRHNFKLLLCWSGSSIGSSIADVSLLATTA